MYEWDRESTVNKAKVIAHYIYRTMREAYCNEKQMDKSNPKAKGPSYEKLMDAYGMGM